MGSVPCDSRAAGAAEKDTRPVGVAFAPGSAALRVGFCCVRTGDFGSSTEAAAGEEDVATAAGGGTLVPGLAGSAGGTGVSADVAGRVPVGPESFSTGEGRPRNGIRFASD